MCTQRATRPVQSTPAPSCVVRACFLFGSLALLVSACGVASGNAHELPDASAPIDAGGAGPDSGAADGGGFDAGAPDAGSTTLDAGLPVDAGTPDASVGAISNRGVINPACPSDLGEIVDFQFPARMDINTMRYATVTVANTGSSAWSEAQAVRLGSPDNDDPFVSNARFELGGGVTVEGGRTPPRTHTFRFPLTAPSTPGPYVSDWQMVREGVCWFGDRLTVPITVREPVATGMCLDPAPHGLDEMKAVIHNHGPTRITLDSTPKVCNREYCLMVGFYDGRNCCPPRPEGHPDVMPCNEAIVGRATDTGRVGPTWTFNGQLCGPNGPGNCDNHPDNQFLLWVYGPGTARACGNLNGVCGEVVVP